MPQEREVLLKVADRARVALLTHPSHEYACGTCGSTFARRARSAQPGAHLAAGAETPDAGLRAVLTAILNVADGGADHEDAYTALSQIEALARQVNGGL